MSTNTFKKRNVKVLNKDFNSLKQDLVEHIKVYFPNDYQDFNQSSIGMMLVELSAYVGDSFNFYLDKKFDETFLQTAKERKNILKHAKHLGFKAFGKTSAFGKVDCFLKVPNIVTNGKNGPDMRYAGTVRKGAKLLGNNGQAYETVINADFSTVDISDNSKFLLVAETDSTTNQPKSWALKLPDIDVVAGTTKSTTFIIGAYKAFLKVTIPDEDVMEILSMTDSDGNIWYEVDYLAQDTIFDSVTNTSTDSSQVPYVLRLVSVPRRFVTEYDITTNKTSIIFGTGDASSFDGELIPNLGDLSLPLFGKDTFTDFSIDPQNFLKTRTLGLTPVNTTLTINYRIGGGSVSNSGANQVITVSDFIFEISDSTLDQSLVGESKNSFSVTNPLAIFGGKDLLSTDELVQLISSNFSAQNRAVTTEDFIVRCLSLPSKFGSIFRAFSQASNINKNAVELSVITRDTNGNLAVAPSTLKSNIKSYLSKFRMMTDAVDILDAEIINISINFGILVKPEYNKNDVILSCIEATKEYFDLVKWQINQPINRTELRTIIAELAGVLSIYDLTILNKTGTVNGLIYSQSSYNIQANTANDIVYCKPNSMFEIKYPSKDITVQAK